MSIRNTIQILVVTMIIISVFAVGCINDNTPQKKGTPDEKRNQPPIISANQTPSVGFVGVTHEFIGSGYDPDGNIVLYEWDFDGDQIYDWNSTVEGNTTHVFKNTGIYNVSFRVTDNNGSSDADYMEIEINLSLPPSHEVWYSNIGDGSILNGTFNITGGARKSEYYDEILSIQISTNATVWINVTYWEVSDMEYDWFYNLNTTTYSNGTYDISVKAIGFTYGAIIITVTAEIQNRDR